jgi:hypothetical protein
VTLLIAKRLAVLLHFAMFAQQAKENVFLFALGDREKRGVQVAVSPILSQCTSPSDAEGPSFISRTPARRLAALPSLYLFDVT